MKTLKLTEQQYFDACIWTTIQTKGFSYVTEKELNSFAHTFVKLLNHYNKPYDYLAVEPTNFTKQLKNDSVVLRYKGIAFYGIKGELLPRVKETVESFPENIKTPLNKIIEVKLKALGSKEKNVLNQKVEQFEQRMIKQNSIELDQER